MNNKNKTIHILSGFTIIMLTFIQIINPENHHIIYNFFSWIAWPAIFFIVGYMRNKNLKMRESFVLSFKLYLLPYFIVGILIIIFNKIIQILNLEGWLHAPFPSMSAGLKALLYGNGNPVTTVFGYFDTGIGLLWLLVALFTTSVLMSIVIKINSFRLMIILVIILAGSGSYLSTMIQLPWSLESAMTGLPFMLFGFYFKNIKNWYVGAATFIASVLTNWTFSMSSGLDMANANVPFWLLGILVGWLSLIGLIIFVNYVINLFPRLSIIFIKLGSYLNITLASLAFVNSIIPVGNYISRILHNGIINLLIVLLITLAIVLIIKFIVIKVLSFQSERGVD